MVCFSLASFALLAALIAAEKDINYYSDGLENTSAENPMYWSDSYNILNDIAQFDMLYVTFHNCAWSPYENGGENPCGVAQADSSAYWYMGYTECFRANAAFSLYGILAGEDDKGCTSSTFINSFFTTQGVEYFTESITAAGFQFSNDDDGAQYPAGVTSQCYQGNEDGSDSAYSVSYGLGCSSKNFVEKTYNGTYCDDKKAIGTTDNLATFNKEIQSAKCVAIYNSSNSNNNNNRRIEEGNGDSLNLLHYSRACSVRQSPNMCPDPYGKLHSYASVNEKAYEASNHNRREKVKTAFSWILLMLGCIFIMFAIFVVYRRRRRSQVRSENAQQKTKNVKGTPESGEKKRQPFWKRLRPKSKNSTTS